MFFLVKDMNVYKCKQINSEKLRRETLKMKWKKIEKADANIELIEELIKERGFKKAFISKELGISQSSMTSRLKDKTLWKKSELVKLAEIFELDVDSLIKVRFKGYK